MRSRQALAAAAAAAVVGGFVLAAVGAAPAAVAAVPAEDAATVRLTGAVSPAAPDVRVPATTITIPLTVTNTSDVTLYDVAVSALRSAPITSSANLGTAFGGQAVEESDFTTRGPSEDLRTPLAPGASERIDYVVDSGSEDTGICLCVTGVYAVDLVVRAAEEPDGETGPVARTQTYLPSLTQDVTAPSGVGWLWPLLDRPHRFASGSVFADDDLAASVASGGRLDRALQVVEDVDAAAQRRPAVSKAMTLLLDPELLDELVTMTRPYTVESTSGATTAGTGGTAAAAWLARLAAVLPRHDVRLTAPADPDVVGLAQRGVTVDTSPDSATATEVATALGRPGATLPAHDLAWPVDSDLDATGLAALTAGGATGVVTTAATDDDGSVARIAVAAGGSDDATPALLADPTLSEQAAAAIGVGEDTASGLQRLVATAAMTSVAHPEDARFVFVLPDRDLDVDPAAATRAVLATAALGPPTSPLTALAGAGDSTARSDLLVAAVGPPPGPLAAAVDAAAGASSAAATIRAAVVSGADAVIGDLPSRVQRVASSSWPGAPEASARATAALTARAADLADAVRIVVRPTGSYSLASADAPLLLTVANDLAVPVRIRVDVQATSRANGFSAGDGQEVSIAASSRQTVRVPTSVTRSGRFDVAVTLRTTDGAMMGPPARITVTSTAVGVVGQIVTYGAGALLVLALVLRGVRRMFVRSRAGSDPPGPDGASPQPDGARPEDPSTVPATRP